MESSEIESYFSFIGGKDRSRVINVIMSLPISDINQLRLFSDKGLAEIPGAGVTVIANIRRVFPYDPGYRESLSLGQRLQAEMFDPEQLHWTLANQWTYEKFAGLFLCALLICYPFISYLDYERFTDLSNNELDNLTTAQKLEFYFSKDDPRDFAFYLVNTLTRDRYVRLLELMFKSLMYEFSKRQDS